MYNLMNKDGLCVTKVDSNSVSLNYNRDLAKPFSESQGKEIMRNFPYMGLALIREEGVYNNWEVD